MYMIKPNGNLGYSLMESSNTGKTRRAEYEEDGYRVVTELEYTIARLVSVHNVRLVIRIANRCAEEMGEGDWLKRTT